MKCVILFVLCVFAFCIKSIDAQRPYFGRCPYVKSATNVKIDKFLGKWYEVERSFYIYELPNSCTTVNLERPDNTTKELLVSIKTYNKWTRRSLQSSGKATPKGDGSAVLDYKVDSRLPDFIARMLPGAGRYTLLATDHETYALIYSCSDLRLFHADTIWVLGRKPDIPIWARAEIYDKLNHLGLRSDHLILTSRKDCPFT